MASSTVIISLRSMNSTVIMLPALYSGYRRRWFISALVSGLAFARIFFTTLAGISSRRSVASSAMRLSIICDASVSDIEAIMYCWSSSSSSANTSAAISFGSILKSFNESSSSISSMAKAISTTFISSIFFLSVL